MAMTINVEESPKRFEVHRPTPFHRKALGGARDGQLRHGSDLVEDGAKVLLKIFERFDA